MTEVAPLAARPGPGDAVLSAVRVSACDSRLRQMLRCPCSRKSVLTAADDGLSCLSCGSRFPVVDRVPVLINDENSVFARDDYVAEASAPSGDGYKIGPSGSMPRRLYRRFAVWLTDYSVKLDYLTSADCLRMLAEEPGEHVCLVIGCGGRRFDAPANVRMIYTDIAFGPVVELVADAHDIPLPDQSVDLVVADAILEHVVDPQRCVAEFTRVLKSGGRVYAATPFLQPVHMGAYDFCRFSHLGHRRLFRWFDEIESGMCLGPGSVLGWAVQRAVLSLTDNVQARKFLRLGGLIVTLPLKWLDRIYRRHRGAIDAAGGVFFYGSKRTSPIPDRAIIGMYRGLDGAHA